MSDLTPKQEKMIPFLQHQIVIQAIVYSHGAEGLVAVCDALAKLPEEQRPAFGAQYKTIAQELAKEDLYFLTAYVLDNAVVLDEFHKEMCIPSGHWDAKGSRVGASRELDLWPREHMKSTVLTEARSVQFILNDPDTRILIVNEILANSETFIQKIKRYFEKCEALIWLFGDWVGHRWNSDTMIVKTRKKNLKEPTVSIGALGHLPVSQHYDIIIADDVVGRSNVGTAEQMKKVEQFFSDLEDLLDKEHGLLSIIGTRWNFNDYYAKVIKRYKDHHRWRIRVHKIYREDGSILFPKRFSQDTIEYLKVTKGPYDFNCQYMLEPVSDEEAIFKEQWWKDSLYGSNAGLKTAEGKPRRFQVAITCDPASSNKKNSDYTAIMVVGADEQGVWWLLDMYRDRMMPQDTIAKLFEVYEMWKPLSPHVKVGIETIGFQNMLKVDLQKEMRRKSVFFQVVDLKSQNNRKEDRIKSLVPRFSNSSIKVPDRLPQKTMDGKTVDMTQALYDEFSTYPQVSHDDMMDCLAYVNQIMPPTSGNLQPGVPSAMSTNWVKDVLMGRQHPKMVAAKLGIRKEDVDATVNDYRQNHGMGNG